MWKAEQLVKSRGQVSFQPINTNGCREYILLRADVGRLPFQTGSVAAIHAGAAIHCWPNPTSAVCGHFYQAEMCNF